MTVEIGIEPDGFGGLVCTLAAGDTRGVARASNSDEAASDLLNMLDSTATSGTGECFWLRESGAYRWLIRRSNDNARVVVLWSAGTLTGWENVFWSDCDWAEFERSARACATQHAHAAAQS